MGRGGAGGIRSFAASRGYSIRKANGPMATNRGYKYRISGGPGKRDGMYAKNTADAAFLIRRAG